MTLSDRIRQHQAKVAIVGMGRVGLPLAVAFADAGLRVMGVETDPARRQSIELGKMPFHEPGSEELLAGAVAAGQLTVHSAPVEAIPPADAVVLAVGTPLAADLRPDYRQMLAALEQVAGHLRRGQLLIQRSTVSPGTLQKVVAPFLRERVPEVAKELLLAACPERIAEGRAMEELASLPEVLGGVDDESSQAAGALFSLLGPRKHIHVTDPTSAELVKLFTNVYRYVNFALANEFAILGEHFGVDTHRIVEMANDGYPRAAIPRPGPAGGPCLSKDGYFLVEELTMPDFVLLAWKLNDSMPAHVVRRLIGQLAGHGVELARSRVAVLGRTFKRDSDDLRQSPALRIAEILSREGADVRGHDPFVSGPTLEETLGGAHAFILATNHSFYEALRPYELADLMDAPRVGMDCWGMLDRKVFAAAGISVSALGVGTSQ